MNQPPVIQVPHDILPIMSSPTPLRRYQDIEGVGALSVKDEGKSGQRYGGNKIRKLAHILGYAKAKQYSRVATCGGVGSNHCLATAIYANAHGLDVELHHMPQEATPHVQENLKALAGVDAELHHYRSTDSWLSAISSRASKYSGEDSETLWIDMGGSMPMGVVGYIEAAREILVQHKEANLSPPDLVYVPAGTGGTMLGLALGFAWSKVPVRVVGVRVTPAAVSNRAKIQKLYRGVRELLKARGQDVELPRLQWELRGEFLGDGYGVPSKEGAEAIDWGAEVLGVTLESTYTAKCVSCLVSDLEAGRLVGKSVVYCHTLNRQPLPALSRLEAIARLPEAYARYLT